MKKLSLFFPVLFCGMMAMAQLQAPGIQFPADSAVAVDVNVRLDWNPALGGTVTSYECQLSSDANFTSPVTLPIYGTSAKTSDLDYDTRYFWRVRAKNTTTTSAWSATRTFVTFHDEFTGLAPANTDRNPNLRLRWDTIPGTNFYQYQYADDSNFTVNLHTAILKAPFPSDDSAPGGKAEAAIKELMFGHSYYWRVRSYHTKDTSGWSARVMFTVRNSITLNSPANNAINVNPQLKLRCDQINGVTEFRIVISDDSTFSPNAKYLHTYVVYAKDFSGGTVEALAEYLDFGRKYYWRARGVHNKDVSDWSDFRVLNTLDQVTLLSPTNNAQDLGVVDVQFQWEEIPGTDGYIMELDTDPVFAAPRRVIVPTLGANIDDGKVSVVLNIASSHTVPYNWRVFSYHFRDSTMWSNVNTFTTLPVGIVERSKALNMSLYPNPADDKVFINLNGRSANNALLELYNIVGEKVDEQSIGQNSSGVYTYDVSSFDKGIYMLTILQDDERITQRLIVK